MITVDKPIKEVTCTEQGRVPEAIYSSSEPIVIRGLVSDWPLVKWGLNQRVMQGIT